MGSSAHLLQKQKFETRSAGGRGWTRSRNPSDLPSWLLPVIPQKLCRYAGRQVPVIPQKLCRCAERQARLLPCTLLNPGLPISQPQAKLHAAHLHGHDCHLTAVFTGHSLMQ